MDMSGAAAVAATLITIAKLKPKINVIGALPIVENMPSGSASRPGDVVRSYSGKSIEIGNTDAEGRLILADAMAYVSRKYKPQTLIDLATLTGACVVALGEKIAGVFSEDDDLAETIVASAGRPMSAAGGCRCRRITKNSLKATLPISAIWAVRAGAVLLRLRCFYRNLLKIPAGPTSILPGRLIPKRGMPTALREVPDSGCGYCVI